MLPPERVISNEIRMKTESGPSSIDSAMRSTVDFFECVLCNIIHFSGIEGCVKDREQKLLHCETAINICFLIHFGIRFLAASDKLWFWLEMNSIVDFCTVPPVFVGIYLNRHYLGIYRTKLQLIYL